jgi:hypothetical protein
MPVLRLIEGLVNPYLALILPAAPDEAENTAPKRTESIVTLVTLILEQELNLMPYSEFVVVVAFTIHRESIFGGAHELKYNSDFRLPASVGANLTFATVPALLLVILILDQFPDETYTLSVSVVLGNICILNMYDPVVEL